MQDLTPILQRIAADLREIAASFAVAGGLAVSARTQPRFTADVDVAVAVAGDREAERILRFLIQRRYRLVQELDNIVTRRLATVRLLPPGSDIGESDPVLDLLFCASGIEPEVVRDATLMRVLPAVELPTAQVPHLIAMKVLSASQRRKVDFVDLDMLVAATNPDGLEVARRLLTLIMERGFSRGEDLHAKFEAHLRTLR